MPPDPRQSTFTLNRPLCTYGNQCPIFIHFVNNNDYHIDDIDHCSKVFHPGRRCGITIEENFQLKKFQTAYQSCNKPRAHQRNRNFWGGKVNRGDLRKEVKRNGHEQDLTSKLYKKVKEKLEDKRHIEMGSPLSYEQMLAILLYTDTVLYKKLRSDEMEFSMQDVSVDTDSIPEQRWPIFGRVLNSAICCLNKYDRAHRPAIVYHGLHGVEIDPSTFRNEDYGSRPKTNSFFKYGTFISTSQDEGVANMFMAVDAHRHHTIGSLLEIHTGRDEDGNEVIGADVSWISKFPEEVEFLIARLVQLGIDDLDFDPEKKFHLAKTSVEFFAHRGQMCYSLDHDMAKCSCDVQPGRRPSWMPPPVSGPL